MINRLRSAFRRSSGRHEVGSVLAETAITVALCLSLITFSIQIGLLGFLQETADAASFVYAHGNAIGVNDSSGSAAVAMNKVFPQIPVADASSMPSAAPTPYIPVDYGYNGTTAEQSSAQTNRHGGITEIQPQSYDSYITKKNTTTQQGFQIGINAKASEAYNRECTGHFNVAGSNAPCGATGGPSSSNLDYISQGANTSPYYMGFNYQWHCSDTRPWTQSYCDFQKNEYITAYAMGSALFAHRTGDKFYNSTDTLQSDGTNNLTATGGGCYEDGGPGSCEGSFIAQACVARDLLWISQFFGNYPSLTSLYNDWFTRGNNPALPLLVKETTSSNIYNQAYPTHNGLYFFWSNMYDQDDYYAIYDSVRGMPFDYITDYTISNLYQRDYDYISTGYPTTSYSEPGTFPYASREGCGYGPDFPNGY